MDYLTVKTLHVAAALGLFTALGAIFLGGSAKKGASILHGVSLLLILLAGLAMIHLLGAAVMKQTWWMIKLGLWLFIGAAPVIARRKVLPPWMVLVLCLAAGAAAAWLGLHKPF